jgi:hypothetical protein
MVVVPAGNFTGIIDANDEQASSDVVSGQLAIEQRDVRQPFGMVMIIQNLLQVLTSGDVDDSSRSRVRCGHDEAVAMLRV